MRSFRILLPLILIALSGSVFAQSDAQKAFDKLKTLAGTWEGTLEGAPVQVTMRVTSMGNAIVHEMKGGGPEDPITMIYLEGDRLLLTHYCDLGNRPRLVGKFSADGKTLDFDFLDITNFDEKQGGHMQRSTFTFVDSDRHTEKWEFAMADGKPMGASLELKRK